MRRTVFLASTLLVAGTGCSIFAGDCNSISQDAQAPVGTFHYKDADHAITDVGKCDGPAVEGTLTVRRLEQVCLGNESGPNEKCGVAFDATLDVPASTGPLRAHLDAKRNDTVETSRCSFHMPG
jgi:hypothetical protein